MARTSAVSQDHQNIPVSPLPLSPPATESQDLPESEPVIASSSPPTTASIESPMVSTTTTPAAVGVDESVSPQKASIQVQQQQQEAVVPQTLQTFLTFLLVSGKRKTMSFEQETTIGRVKELIWNAWPTGQSCFTSFMCIFFLSLRMIL